MSLTKLRVGALLLCLMCLLPLLPGSQGGFVFDDNPNIINNTALNLPSLTSDYLIEAALANPVSPGQRWLAMLSFALNRYWLGDQASAFKWVNIALHFSCGFAFAWMLRVLNRISNQRIFGAHSDLWCLALPCLWMLTPINMSPALYIVQRMTSLMALFSLLTFGAYMSFRWHLEQRQTGKSLMWALAGLLFALLAVSSKENGALLPLETLLLESLLLRQYLGQTPLNRGFGRLLLIVVLLPLCAALGYLVLHPEWVQTAYAERSFTPSERLLTQARVLWFYAAQTFVPMNASLGLFHDDWILSTSLSTPATTLPAIAGWIIYLLLAWRFRHSRPVASFGLLFFLAAHSMEASFLPLEIIHEHRNYLPSTGLFIGLAGLVAPSLQANQRPSLLASLLLYGMVLASLQAIRADSWKNAAEFAQTEVVHHPDSTRARYEWARALIAIATQNNRKDLIPVANEALFHADRTDPSNPLAAAALVFTADRFPTSDNTLPTAIDRLLDRMRTSNIPFSAAPFLTEITDIFKRHPDQRAKEAGITQALSGNPHNPRHVLARWHVERARLFVNDNAMAQADEALREAIKTSPGEPELKEVYGIFLRDSGKLPEARQLFAEINHGIFGLANPQLDSYIREIDAQLATETREDSPAP